MIKITIIGTGNIAKHLFDTFKLNKNVSINEIVGRNTEALKYFAATAPTQTNFNNLKTSDLYIISVSDDAIEEVSTFLEDKKGVVAHTTGSVAMSVLNKHSNHGVFYPMQTFTKNQVVDFRSVPMCIEANNEESYSVLSNLANYISNVVYDLSSEQRKKMHLAAVFINNFSNYMYQIGNEICQKNNVPFSILKPLILETAKKGTSFDPESIQTGPGKRGDLKTIEIHKSQITNKEHLKIYTVLTEAILNKYGKEL